MSKQLCEGEKVTLWSRFSQFICSLVLLIKIRSSNLGSKHCYLLGILDGQTVGCVYACVFVICLII